MTPNNRNDAASAGATFFNTGRPCKNGHTADRYTSTGHCVECLRSHRNEIAVTLREARRPVGDGSRLFSYRLHADDHAAALAFCQALDLQRGRTPQVAQAVAAQPPRVSATPEEVARHRERILRDLGATAAPARDNVMSEEMRASLVAAGVL